MNKNISGISVVIPNYNGAELLPLILPTVQVALERLSIPSEIIVADDASTDNSPDVINSSFPNVRIAKSERNRGFAPTANLGIGSAAHPIVLLLNSDVKLEPDYFEKQLRYFDDESTFGVMGRIVGWDDNVVQDAAKYPRFHGVKIKTSGNYLPLNPSESSHWPSMYLSGANMLINKKLFFAIGGFNELFAPYYVEDYELCLRAWRFGFKCYYEHQSVCRHQVSKTIKASSKKNQINAVYNRNKMFLHFIHLDGWRLSVWFVTMLLESCAQILIGKFYFIQSLKMFFVNIKQARLIKQNLKLNRLNTKLLSVQQVAHNILTLIDTKKIEIF